MSETLSPPPRRPGSRRLRRVLLAAGTGVLLAIVAVFVLMLVKVPRVAFLPGSVNGVAERITVTGADSYDDEGEILFVTVRFNDDVTLLEFIDEGRDQAVDFVSRDDFYGEQTPDENREENFELMQTSKDVAVLVALDQLGYDVYEEAGAGIQSVEEGQPASGLLNAGDVVVAIDGTAITTTDELVATLTASEPGDTVELEVRHPDRPNTTVDIELGARPDGGPGGFLGVATSTAVDEKDLGVDIEVNTGEVGGNSAGLALTLAIIDKLTPGDLTGGQRVVVTGTIEVGGAVGLIGGIKQKAVAASRAGADVFIVPMELADQAARYADGVQVIGVADLGDALAALADLGGNAAELSLPALEEVE